MAMCAPQKTYEIADVEVSEAARGASGEVPRTKMSKIFLQKSWGKCGKMEKILDLTRRPPIIWKEGVRDLTVSKAFCKKSAPFLCLVTEVGFSPVTGCPCFCFVETEYTYTYIYIHILV
jgi:hypothetical protein